MSLLAEFEPWWRFAFALLIGALIGLEREFFQQKIGAPDFAGIRTFSLISLLGAVTAFLVNDFGVIFAVLALAGLILMTTVSYSGALNRSGTEPGITTEVAAILTFLFGVLVIGEQEIVAIALAVVTSLLMAMKGRIHGAIRDLSTEDIHVTLQFALVAAVILPLLPNRALDPLGLLNPFQIWLMVVFISGIGFSGYILINIFGHLRGINLMGFLGGLASSTATTISFSSASKENPHMAAQYARAVIMASTVMFPRILFLILVIYYPLALKVAAPLAVMLATGLILIFIMGKRKAAPGRDAQTDFKISNPLKLSTAIKFGLLFAVVLIIIEFALNSLGTAGVYLTSLLTGLTDADAITLSVTRLATNKQINLQVAGIAVVSAALTNTISKGAISYFSGSRELRNRVLPALGIIILTGLVSAGISFIWL
jgi:uncharacterized membrane protein (DUF4010 family)